MAKDIITLDRNGVQVEFSKTELVSLTQLWRMAGSPQSQTPNKWKILPEAKRLVKQISKEDKGFKSSFMESKRGKGGETLAHYKIAIMGRDNARIAVNSFI